MAKVPAVKRRKLDSPTAAEPASTLSNFYQNAAGWDLEQDYESRPRKGKKREKENTRLPIKTSDGLIKQVDAPTKEQEEASDQEWLEEDSQQEEEPVPEKVEEKPKVPLRQQILEAKEELARIALLLNENPEENAGAFKTLAQFSQSPIVTIKKLALATQLTVYKDVIPGYRIRPLGEEDMTSKVSKEVRKLRAYEQSLVVGYKEYIEELAKLASAKVTGADVDVRSLRTLALSCACSLLVAVPHFNFRGELLKILVGKLSTRKIDEDFVKCRETIEGLFRDDEDGTASLNAVELLTKMIKGRNYHVDESVLNTFLHLRLLDEFSWKASQNKVDKPKHDALAAGKKLKEKREVRTKKQRKLMKERKEIEKEMSQADAIVSHEERDRMQAETLKLVFVVYFRILKSRNPKLMGAVLEGLARYAHLINQEFFGDILEALKDLIRHTEELDEPAVDEEDAEQDDEDTEATRNISRESLLCIITAFALLEGQDAAKAASTLHLDLSFFISHLYRTLHSLSLNPDIELSSKSLHLSDPNDASDPSRLSAKDMKNKVNHTTTTVLLLRSLNSILLPPTNIRAVSPLRLAAFTKHLYTIALQLPEKSCSAVLSLLEKVSMNHGKKIGALWHTEERKGDGRYTPLAGDVEGANPFAATCWEGELLRKHFSPKVRESVGEVERGILKAR